LETYLMNTEDVELHVLLEDITRDIQKYRINPIETVLKKEGFTVPPKPGTKVSGETRCGTGNKVK